MAYIAKVTFNFVLGQLAVAELDLVMQGAALRVLEYHVGSILLFLVVVVEQSYYFRMVELVVHVDLVLGVATIYLHQFGSTILIATISPVSVLRANLTYP